MFAVTMALKLLWKKLGGCKIQTCDSSTKSESANHENPPVLNPIEKFVRSSKMNLIVRKYSGDDDDHGQDDAEIEVVIRRLLVGSCLKSRKSPTQSFVK